MEDIVDVQALASKRKIYTDRAGYALSKQVDTDLIQLGRGFNGGAGTAAYANAFIGGDGTTAYTSGTPNQTALTAAGIRRTIQRLDDNDVPFRDRFFLVPPSAKSTILGITDFTFWSSVGEAGKANSVRNGLIGDIYGIPVYVTTNADTATGGARICIMGHMDAAVLAMQQDVRIQVQKKLEYLGDLFVADVIYGVGELRDTSAFVLAVPA